MRDGADVWNGVIESSHTLNDKSKVTGVDLLTRIGYHLRHFADFRKSTKES